MNRVFVFALLSTMALFSDLQTSAQEESKIDKKVKPPLPAVIVSALDTSVIKLHTTTLEGDADPDNILEDASGGTTTKNVSVRTSPTDHRGRKSDNDYASNTLPAGYFYDINSAETHKTVDIGTSNWIKVTFHDYFELPGVPGAYVPRTMRVQAHARSGHGRGTRGKTAGWGRAKYKKVPEILSR